MDNLQPESRGEPWRSTARGIVFPRRSAWSASRIRTRTGASRSRSAPSGRLRRGPFRLVETAEPHQDRGLVGRSREVPGNKLRRARRQARAPAEVAPIEIDSLEDAGQRGIVGILAQGAAATTAAWATTAGILGFAAGRVDLARHPRLVLDMGELVCERGLAHQDVDPKQHRQALVRRVGQGCGAGAGIQPARSPGSPPRAAAAQPRAIMRASR